MLLPFRCRRSEIAKLQQISRLFYVVKTYERQQHTPPSLSLRIVPVALSALEAKDVERYGARRQTVITNDVHRHVLVLVGHRCILNLGIQPIIVTLNLVALIQTLAAQRARHGTLPVQLTQTLAMDGMTAVW